ncbi:DUF3021 domain-containing protein [Fructobacillus sp. M1-13]|uniref:DUF3021 domain-containing protein n=1 Tax=Fructobacillus papyriferae TaxID=2713171 RepID=A0ABS5QUF2_9LACO|nr:DUF3021 domain-containing protein [Fructobacillus papyriferae]MBS9335562.1 DUF3021 domain-containing protein [Fructobacillus papyriferae]MCD2159348.1 DUF3021 domain-containing protein [Fructobacillus papyriferae]
MKKIIQHIVSGIGFGSATYLIILSLQDTSSVTIPLQDIWAILLMSACIGLLSTIFDSDRLSFFTLFIIHLLGTAVIVWLTGKTTGCFHTDMNNPVIWLYFSIAYAIIWLVILMNMKKTVSDINRALTNRQQNKKD